MTIPRLSGSVPPQEIYKMKLCPVKSGTEVYCDGPKCALYIQQLNEKGHVLGGNCAYTTSAIAQAQTLNVLNALVEVLSQQRNPPND